MKKAVSVFFMALILSACLPDQPAQGLTPPASVGDLTSRLAGKVGTPITPDRLERFLLSVLPDEFAIREQSASIFPIAGIPVTRGRIVATNGSGYLAITVYDLVADSASYVQVYRRYLEESPPETPDSEKWATSYGGFAWTWQETGTDIHYLEAGLLDRYHVQIRSNLNQPQMVFDAFSQRANWHSMHEYPE